MSERILSQQTQRATVAIIGGGFTGAALAAQLLREGDRSVSVVVIERGPSRGRGVAYGTQYGWHLLNVPSCNMSAFADDPDHFLRWARKNYDSRVEAGSFLPRRVYGQYLETILRDAEEAHPGQLRWVCDEAGSIVRSKNETHILLRSGGTVIADKVVLALGNFPPSNPPLPGRSVSSERYVSFAWSAGALRGVEKENSVLLVGTGLTAVDLAVALRAKEFRGTIHLLSRRGFLPHTHKPSVCWPAFWDKGSPKTIRGLTRLVRQQVRDASGDWRAVIDSMRPFTQDIWKSLPENEQRRFLRHVRPYWEVHRHRIAPEIGGLIGYQLANHQIQAHAGRVTNFQEDGGGVTVTYKDRKSGKEEHLRVDRVINCTGPETDCRRLDDPLLTSLWIQRMARPDRLFLGLDVDENGALIDAQGEPSKFLFAVGPSRKGSLWETTAVPEIRGQVAGVVRHLLAKSRKSVRRDVPPLRESFAATDTAN
jgi:uncharacterized NAD(P)/FAD-binding protein YdhS